MAQGNGFNFQAAVGGNQAGNLGGITGGQAKADPSALLGFMASIAATDARSAGFIGEALDSAGKSILQGSIAAKNREVVQQQIALQQAELDEKLRKEAASSELLTKLVVAQDKGGTAVEDFYNYMETNPQALASLNTAQLSVFVSGRQGIETNTVNDFLNNKAITDSLMIGLESQNQEVLTQNILNGIEKGGAIMFDRGQGQGTFYNIPAELTEKYNKLPAGVKSLLKQSLETKINESIKTKQTDQDLLLRGQKQQLDEVIALRDDIRENIKLQSDIGKNERDFVIDQAKLNIDTYNAQTSRYLADTSRMNAFSQQAQIELENKKQKQQSFSKGSPQDVLTTYVLADTEFQKVTGGKDASRYITDKIVGTLRLPEDPQVVNSVKDQVISATSGALREYYTDYATGKTNSSIQQYAYEKYKKLTGNERITYKEFVSKSIRPSNIKNPTIESTTIWSEIAKQDPRTLAQVSSMSIYGRTLIGK